MAKINYSVELEGKVIGTRKSDRTYTHAVAVTYFERVDGSILKDDDGWGVLSFHGSLELARKRAENATSMHPGGKWHEAQVLPVIAN